MSETDTEQLGLGLPAEPPPPAPPPPRPIDTALEAPLVLVFDVESVGLHGEGFAAGWVAGRLKPGAPFGFAEEESGRVFCHWDRAQGGGRDREWVRRHVGAALKDITPTHPGPRNVRDAFWAVWTAWRRKGALLVADVAWPVEARFLLRCVDEDQSRALNAPYPLLDVAAARWAMGYGRIGVPTWGQADRDRLPDELREHDPLADARYSARLLGAALERVRAAGAR